MPSVGSILQLVCQRCGQVNTYKRKVVGVDRLNDEIAKREKLVTVVREMLDKYDESGLTEVRWWASYRERLRAAVKEAER